ncbi:MAG: hypothetical protein EBS69_07960 [Verrucomicrobia bacterium]|nr:hypothetical protein [Verrucomicrobiota bacterium]
MSLSPSSRLAPTPEDEDFISLAPLWGIIRRYRRWLELSLFALAVLAGGLVSAAYIALPKGVKAGLEFTLNFPDAALGVYPNRLPFRPEDLLETSLLRGLYDQNNLQVYLKFDEFKSGFSLERAGKELDLLQREFRVRLDDRKLTLADREKIEAQYEAQLKSLPPTSYRLNFSQSARQARLIPPVLLTKILEEILRRWSDDAVNQKKVLVFAALLPGQMTLPAKGGDSLVALTELLERTRVLAEGLGALARLPGGYQASLPDGTRLADLFLQLNLLQEIRIPQIRSALFGSIADPAQAGLTQRVFRMQVRIKEDRLRQAQEKLRGALLTYRDYLASRTSSPVAPGRSSAEAGGSGSGGGTQLQISDTFLTKLMELGRGNEDIQYRTSLVEKIRDGRLQVAAEESALRETREILEALAKDPPAPEKTSGPAKAKIPAAPASGTDFGSSLNLGCRQMNSLIADGLPADEFADCRFRETAGSDHRKLHESPDLPLSHYRAGHCGELFLADPSQHRAVRRRVCLPRSGPDAGGLLGA